MLDFPDRAEQVLASLPTVIVIPSSLSDRNQLIADHKLKMGESYRIIGETLKAVRDSGQWRQDGWANFEAFCDGEHGIAPSTASRMIKAFDVATRLQLGSDSAGLPVNESQIRQLAKLPDEMQSPMWKALTSVFDESQITAALVTRAVKAVSKVVQEIIATHGYVSVNGSSVALQAAISEQMLSTIKSQAGHIAEALNRRNRRKIAEVTLLGKELPQDVGFAIFQQDGRVQPNELYTLVLYNETYNVETPKPGKESNNARDSFPQPAPL